MFKKILFILSGLLLLILFSCDGNFSDGTITVKISGLDRLTGFSSTTSKVLCTAKVKNGDKYTLISTSGFDGAISELDSSLSFGIGNPDYIFSGGTVYTLDILVDINGDSDFTEVNLDYWLEEPKDVAIDGNMSVSFDNTDLIYTF